MKSILVPTNDLDVLDGVLAAAECLRARVDGFIEAAHFVTDPTAVMASDDTGATLPALVERFAREDGRRADEARRRFAAFASARGLDRLDPPRAAWAESEVGLDSLGNHARVFDAVVVGRPVRGRTSPSLGTLETALFDSGQAILVTPPVPPGSLGADVLIAWNGSAETARTIRSALPLLRLAERVTVLTVTGMTVPGPSGDAVVRQLTRHGITSSSLLVEAGLGESGHRTLEIAAERGADLLIKGGYTRGRLRQALFGGPTSHILFNADLPVFMAH